VPEQPKGPGLNVRLGHTYWVCLFDQFGWRNQPVYERTRTLLELTDLPLHRRNVEVDLPHAVEHARSALNPGFQRFGYSDVRTPW
jgi:hypothetical protein